MSTRVVGPLVSILTNTYNRADLIHRCIESIQKQTYKNYEHIIVDGNSTDNTEEVVKAYHDPHIVYVKLRERGPEKQMRAGSSIARGTFITFLDDDDEYLPDKIEKQVSFMESRPNNIGLVYCWMTYYDNSDPNTPVRFHKPKYKGDVSDICVSAPLICGTPTMMVRKDVFMSVGGTFDDSSGIIGSDWELFARICQKCNVDYIPESLIKVYINHGFSRLSTDFYTEKAPKVIAFHNHFLREFKSNFDRHPEYRLLHYYNLCYAHASLGEKQQAWHYFKLLQPCHPGLQKCCRLLIKILFNK